MTRTDFPLDKRKKTELHFGVAVIETFQNDRLPLDSF